MELILLSICPLVNFFLAKKKSRNPWLWAILGIPLFFVSTIILFFIGEKKDPNRFFNNALITQNFSPDYISENRAISIDSKSKKIMLESSDNNFRVYSPDEILSFSSGMTALLSEMKFTINITLNSELRTWTTPIQEHGLVAVTKKETNGMQE